MVFIIVINTFKLINLKFLIIFYRATYLHKFKFLNFKYKTFYNIIFKIIYYNIGNIDTIGNSDYTDWACYYNILHVIFIIDIM